MQRVYDTAATPPFEKAFERFSREGLSREGLSSLAQQQQQQQQQTPMAGSLPASPPSSPPSTPMTREAPAPFVLLPPSPPPSAAGEIGMVGATSLCLVLFEMEEHSDWLLRHAWMAGVAGVGLAAGVLALGVAMGVGARYVSVFSSALAVASSLIGWCTPRFPVRNPACRSQRL